MAQSVDKRRADCSVRARCDVALLASSAVSVLTAVFDQIMASSMMPTVVAGISS